MKTLILIATIFASSFIPIESNKLKKESLIDKIERAEYIPIYIITKEVFYSNIVAKNTTDGGLSYYSTCKSIDEGIPLSETYTVCYDKIEAELNRVFKTNKFVIKPISEIPLTDKKGSGLLQDQKVQPSLKSFDFSAVSSPFFVMCSVGAIYSSASLLTWADPTKAQKSALKDWEKEGVEPLDEINVRFSNFINARFLSYDSKKEKGVYADSEILDQRSDYKQPFIQSECFSSIQEFTDKLDPSLGVPEFTSKIEGMFDAFAKRQWKKQK